MTLLEKLSELVKQESPLAVADDYCPNNVCIGSDDYRHWKYVYLADRHPDCKVKAFTAHDTKLCVKCWLREYKGEDKNV